MVQHNALYSRIKDISSRLEEGLGGYKEDDNLRERRESNSPLEEGLGGHKEDDNLRVRRDSYSPLYMLGSLADWAIGLTSHQKYSQFQVTLEGGCEGYFKYIQKSLFHYFLHIQ